MESEVTRWLRKRYCSAPSEGSQAKIVRFSDLHHELSTHFTSTAFNARMISQEIKTAFPNTFSKAVGSARTKHIFGIECVASASPPSTSETSEREAQLINKVQELEARVRELEQPSKLSLEMNGLLTPHLSLYHGPNTIDNFNKFLMDELVGELTKLAPNLYKLFQDLGQTYRHAVDNESEGDNVMAVMSLCTLLKCRSQKVLGVQLLIALMLLARSTNKQVCTPGK
jgi:hypothetical protein